MHPGLAILIRHAAERTEIMLLAAPLVAGCARTPTTHAPSTDSQQAHHQSGSSAASTPVVETLGPAPVRQVSSVEESVEFALGSFVTNVSPGDNRWLTATFRIPSGAHIYWRNPGETGLATDVQFNVPRGFRVGPTEYPGPRRFRGERNSTAYGYAESVVLFAEVGAPEHWSAPVEISASASWLACSDVCVKATGHATYWLAPEQPPTAGPEVLRQFSLLPQPLPRGLEPTRRPSSAELLLNTTPELQPVEFFPLEAFGPNDRDCTNTPLGPGKLQVTLGYETPPPEVRGVVLARVGAREHYFSVVLP